MNLENEIFLRAFILLMNDISLQRSNMFNCIELINENYNRQRKHHINLQDGVAVIFCRSSEIGSYELRDLISDICYVKNVYKKACKKIVINFPKFNPNDKLVYILIECIVYTLLTECHYEVDFRIDLYKPNINTAGMTNSILFNVANEGMDEELFRKRFVQEIARNHFRKVLLDPNDLTAPSLLVTDIKTFLYRYHAKENFDAELALVIGELVDNAFGHAQSACLVDIDITDAEYEFVNDTSEKKYYAVNVCVVNFGGKCIYDDMCKKIVNKKYDNSERYDLVRTAYDYHKTFFSKRYNQDDFFTIASFQENISGRENETTTGGTGLPELVRNLEEYAAENYCYMLSGKNGVMFEKNYLCYTQEGWIGFNEANDFMTGIPRNGVIFRTGTFLPGTGYNFMLVFEGE